jgi:hypothetical protein
MFDEKTTMMPGQRKTLGDLVSEFFSPNMLPLKSRLAWSDTVAALELIEFDLAGQHPSGTKTQRQMLQQQRDFVGRDKSEDRLPANHIVSASDYMEFWIGSKRVNSVSQDGLSRVEFLKGITGAGLTIEDESKKKVIQSIMGGA